MRAASMDFETARLLGVRANRVIAVAVLISGALAAVVAVMLTVQTPLVTPDFALRDTIVVLAGVVLGGMNRPIPATLGGFSIGFASGLLGGALPTNQSQYLPTFLFAAVILVLLVRPAGPVRPDADGGARMSDALAGARRARRRSSSSPRSLGTVVSQSTQTYFIDALVKVAIVVALYVFIGNSGVLVVRAHQLRRASAPGPPACSRCRSAEKPAIMPNLAHFLRHRTVGNVPSLVLAAVVGGVFALVVGAAADAALRARRGHRDVRRARDHAQPAALRGEDRARA